MGSNAVKVVFAVQIAIKTQIFQENSRKDKDSKKINIGSIKLEFIILTPCFIDLLQHQRLLKFHLETDKVVEELIEKMNNNNNNTYH